MKERVWSPFCQTFSDYNTKNVIKLLLLDMETATTNYDLLIRSIILRCIRYQNLLPTETNSTRSLTLHHRERTNYATRYRETGGS